MKLSSATINQQTISFTTLNLFVGSNNAGKSTLLKEIHTATTRGVVQENESKWLDDAQLKVSNLQNKIKSLFREDDISQIDNFEQRQAAEAMGFKPFRGNVSQNLKGYRLSSILNSDAFINNFDVNIKLPKLKSSNQ